MKRPIKRIQWDKQTADHNALEAQRNWEAQGFAVTFELPKQTEDTL